MNIKLIILKNAILSDRTKRIFLLSALIDWFGSGVLLVSSPIFLLKTIGLTENEIGIGFGVYAVAGMLFSIPIGKLTDTWNSRNMLCILHLWRAAMFLIYIFFVHDFISFLIVISLIGMADKTAFAVTQTLATSIGEKKHRIKLLAYYRTIINIGISLGGLAASIIMVSLTKTVFSYTLAINCCSFLFAAFLIWNLPLIDGKNNNITTDVAKRNIPWKKIVVFAPLDGIVGMYIVVLNVALPLWVALSIDVSVQIVGVLYAINTILCILFQVPISQLIKNNSSAANNFIKTGIFLSVSCVCIGWAAVVDYVFLSIVLLTLGVISLTIGEMLHVPASWQISYSLASEGALTSSFAAYNLGRSGGQALGPLIMTSIVVKNGNSGWYILAAVFCVTAVMMSFATSKLLCGPHPRTYPSDPKPKKES